MGKFRGRTESFFTKFLIENFSSFDQIVVKAFKKKQQASNFMDIEKIGRHGPNFHGKGVR